MQPKARFAAILGVLSIEFSVTSICDAADESIWGGAGITLRRPLGLVVLQPCPSATPVGGEEFLQLLALTADRSTLYATANDRLNAVDLETGVHSGLGIFEHGSGYQWAVFADSYSEPLWSEGPITLEGAESYSYVLSGEVTLFDVVYPPINGLSEESMFIHGSSSLPLEETILLDRTFQYPAEGSPDQAVRLVITMLLDGAIQFEFLEFAGSGSAHFDGELTLGTPGAAGAPLLRHPVTGLSMDATGAIYVLTHFSSEPTGNPTLYQVESTPSEDMPQLVMTPVAEVVTEDPGTIGPIEFAPDGRLFVIGETLYSIDLLDGSLSTIGPTGEGPILDLAFRSDGILLGLSHSDDGDTLIHQVDFLTGAATPFVTLPGELVWGLAVGPYAQGDLDRDGDVDDNDVNIYTQEYTGPLSGPVIPAGPGVPWLTDPILVPHVDFMPFPMFIGMDATRIPLDGLDSEFPGIVVTGEPLSLPQSSAVVHVAHDEEHLYVGFEITDDDFQPEAERAEVYLDSNNSDLEMSEGNPYGFQAIAKFKDKPNAASRIGDVGAFSAWYLYGQVTMRTLGAEFQIEKSETEMETGGTYGFDLAITDHVQATGEVTHYFLFSTTEAATNDERQWGNITLAPGPLPTRVHSSDPSDLETQVSTQPTLTWNSPEEVSSYNVFLGSDPGDLIFQGNTSATSFEPGLLSPGWTYFWRVDSVSENGISTGATWRFTTDFSVADLDHDGDVDETDLAAMSDDPYLDTDGDLLADCVDNCPDHANADQADCDADGQGDVCALDSESDDCNGNGVPDSCDLAAFTSLDCTINGIPDECDIAKGASFDCNANAVPDECDITGGDSLDCNTNQTPDECDLADGTSKDCFGNAIPDECELDGLRVVETQRLDPSRPTLNGYFGFSVDADDTKLIAGAYGAGSDDLASGAAFVFTVDPTTRVWSEESVLIPADQPAFANFGYSVAIDEDIVLVGAYGDGSVETFGGSAYVFRFDPVQATWIEEAKLISSDLNRSDSLGFSVALDQSVAVVGAYSADGVVTDAGAAYVFRLVDDGWVEEQKLIASDGAEYDNFGYSAALQGSVAVIGAYSNDDMALTAGAAYVFRFDGSDWIEEVKLTASDGAPSDYFSKSVSMDGDRVVIGAEQSDGVVLNTGAAFVYRFDGVGWVEEAKLTASDGQATDYFGRAVAILGDTILCGAYGDDDRANGSGAAYVYRYDLTTGTWNEQAKLTATDGAQLDYFGRAVALQSDFALIGVYLDDVGANASGSVYAFSVAPADCDADGLHDDCERDSDGDALPDDCDLATACLADANNDGTVDPLDVGFVQARMGCTAGGDDQSCVAADVNRDGTVDPLDLGFVLSRFGECP